MLLKCDLKLFGGVQVLWSAHNRKCAHAFAHDPRSLGPAQGLQATHRVLLFEVSVGWSEPANMCLQLHVHTASYIVWYASKRMQFELIVCHFFAPHFYEYLTTLL